MLLLCIELDKSFWPSSLNEWLQSVSFLLTGAGILIAAISYRNTRKSKRGEWLNSLFEKFFLNNTRYQDARKWLDFGTLEFELGMDPNHTKEEQFSDFLNFFEFIAILESDQQITLSEVIKMFSYYLGVIKKSDFCKEYLKKNGYRNLPVLLSKIN